MISYRSINIALALAAGISFAGGALAGADAPPVPQNNTPQYDKDGKLVFPADYREWVYLSSGLDMSYSDAAPGMHMFDNVFVPREDYEGFLKTGTWPDKTVMVLELRGAATNQSILKHGQIQTEEVMGHEVHVKDAARFEGGWGFFSFDGGEAPAAMIPYTASCYACHQAHGAVDTTFVQFYPTLFTVAKDKKTLSAEFLADMAAAKGE